MAKRKIIEIDEDKCNGCGQCIVDCAEAALQLIDGKARLVKEIYCDGLGACLGSCPTGALTIVEREAVAFDEEATERHVHQTRRSAEKKGAPGGCPGARAAEFAAGAAVSGSETDTNPELTNWPIQLKLVGAKAPYFADADILLAADCSAFSTVHFHSRFIRGKKVIIACPKLDDSQFYYEKLTEIFRDNGIKSVTVVRMEVPCCGGLAFIAQKAIQDSGKEIPYHEVVVGIKGDILSEGRTPLIPNLQRVGAAR